MDILLKFDVELGVIHNSYSKCGTLQDFILSLNQNSHNLVIYQHKVILV